MRLPGTEHGRSTGVSPRRRIAIFEEDLSGGRLSVGVAEIVVGELPQELRLAGIRDIQRHDALAAVSEAQEEHGAPDVGLPRRRVGRPAATVVLGEGAPVVEIADHDAAVGEPLLAAAREQVIEIVEEHRWDEAPELGSRVFTACAGELIQVVADGELAGGMVIGQERVDDTVVRRRIDHPRAPIELPAIRG